MTDATCCCSRIPSHTRPFTLLCRVVSPVTWNRRRSIEGTQGALWARERCRISPPRFLAECPKKRLNQAIFVFAVFFVVCFFCAVFSFCSVSVFNLSSVTYFPACTNVNGTV